MRIQFGRHWSAARVPFAEAGSKVGLTLALLSIASVSEAALNASQQSVAAAIDSSCRASETSVLCSLQSQSEALYKSMTPLQILAIGSMSTRTTGGQLSLLNGTVTDRARLLLRPLKTGGAGDDFAPPLSFWFKTDTDFGERESTNTFYGFRFNNFGLNGGVDYRITDSWVTGLAFTYQRNNSRFDFGRGDTNSDAYSGTLYTSYYITEGLHVEATGSYGGRDYETFRNVTTPSGNERLRAKPGAESYSFSAGGGYDFTYQSVTLSPYARADYLGVDVDAFSESGGLAAVRFNKQNIRSLTSTVGGQVASAISFPWGVLTPQIRGEWHHQFLDDRASLRGAFVADPVNSQFNIFRGAPDRDYYTLGADVSGTFAGGLSAFLSFQTLLGSQHIESHKIMLGTRMEF